MIFFFFKLLFTFLLYFIPRARCIIESIIIIIIFLWETEYHWKPYTIVETIDFTIAPIYIHSCSHSFFNKLFMMTSWPTLAFAYYSTFFVLFIFFFLSKFVLFYIVISSQCLSMTFRCRVALTRVRWVIVLSLVSKLVLILYFYDIY